MRFGEFLLNKGLVSVEEIEDALAVKVITKEKLGRVLVELGLLTQEDCNAALSDFFSPRNEPDLLQNWSKDGPKKFEIIEIFGIRAFLSDGTEPTLYLTVFDDRAISMAEKVVPSFDIKLISVDQAEALNALVKSARSEISGVSAIEPMAKVERDVLTPYGDLFQSLLASAKLQNASDIHFDSGRDGVVVRLRVNGDLIEAKRIKSDHSQSFLAEVKRQTGLPLTVVGAPSSGAARFEGHKLKVRAQSNGQIHGETVVLRLIDEEKTKGAAIERIGADDLFIRELKKAVQFSNGLVLMCGQTGSGKSLTLYSLLMSLDRKTMKVVTIEDPVEYEGQDLMQIEVSDLKCGFKDALKSCLRLDPDVIMVGEIRDEETAELAFKASSTGHLVFSTLHTNGAIEAVTRLKGLGIDDDLIKSNVRLISALTLKKHLCNSCKIEMAAEDLQAMNLDFDSLIFQGAKFFTRKADGCVEDSCVRGAVGRVLLAECADQEAVRCFVNGTIVPGFRTLHQYAVESAANGIIGVEDAMFT
ncbi:MAG: GspE/PulE family protein [Bdellovibrionales bacterium]